MSQMVNVYTVAGRLQKRLFLRGHINMNMSDIVPWPLKDVSKNMGDETSRLMIRAGITRKINAYNLLYMPLGIMAMDKLIDRILKGYGSIYEIVHDDLDDKGWKALFRLLKDEISARQMAFYAHMGTKLEVYFQEGKFAKVYIPEFLRKYIKNVTGTSAYAAINESGNKRFLYCQECGALYQPDILEIKMDLGTPQSVSDIMEVYTPGAVTIDKLCKCLDIAPQMTVKTMIYEIEKQGKKDYYAVIVRGDRTISSEKLRKYFEADSVGLADESIVGSITGSPPGFCGPVGIKAKIYADMEISYMDETVAGANKLDTHVVGCTPGRDFQVEKYLDLRCGVEGDPCPQCGASLKTVKGNIAIEGYKSAEGISRWIYSIGQLLTAIIRNEMDDNGIKWPDDLSPFDAAVEVTSPKNEMLCNEARSITERYSHEFNILYDDRDLGLKTRLSDMDLLGIPWTIIVSGSSLEKGTYELRKNGGEPVEVEKEKIAEILKLN
ncbi:MAG: YbaK/EbsC family protein [Thermoanaerobacteraceae bacterium]|nr:YbaK/EbsC family protein [Thermoanaerobacteraceae bacterium]